MQNWNRLTDRKQQTSGSQSEEGQIRGMGVKGTSNDA